MTAPQPWAPPGLPPATGTARRSRTFALQAALGTVVIGSVFAYLRGVRDDPGLLLTVGAIIGSTALLLGLKTARKELSAGPGWLAVRGVLRRRWVRTDQLTKVTVSRSGRDWLVLLRDAERRRVGVLLSDLLMEPRLARRVAKDVRRAVAGGAEINERARTLLLG